MRTKTSFKTGNNFGAHHNHGRSRVITQQLISALNEQYKRTNMTKLRKLVDRLIEEAIAGDAALIKEISSIELRERQFLYSQVTSVSRTSSSRLK